MSFSKWILINLLCTRDGNLFSIPLNLTGYLEVTFLILPSQLFHFFWNRITYLLAYPKALIFKGNKLCSRIYYNSNHMSCNSKYFICNSKKFPIWLGDCRKFRAGYALLKWSYIHGGMHDNYFTIGIKS